MARTETTPDARVLVGVDISKHRHEVLIAVPGKQRRRTSDPHEHEGGLRTAGRRSLRLRPAGQDRVRGDRQLPSRPGASPFLRRVRAQAGVVGRLGAHAGGPAQQLGQERPEGRAGDPAHASDRRRPGLPRSAARRRERHPGAFEDPRDRLPRQDRALASDPHPLPAALFSGGGSIPPQLPHGLVPGLPRGLSLAALHRRHGQGGVHRRGMDRRRAARLQNRTAVRHLRDREDLRRPARRPGFRRHRACSGWSWRRAAA